MVGSMERLSVIRQLTAVLMFTLSVSVAEAQIPDDFQGLWTSQRDNCDGFYSDGLTVLGVGRLEIGWYEIACAPVETQRFGKALRLDANCEKGGGAEYTSTIELSQLSGGRLRFSWVNTVDGGGDSQVMWACPARHQQTFARGAHPTSGTFEEGTTRWHHNGSTMALEANGELRRFVYVEPRTAMKTAGAAKGDLLFNGRAVGTQYRGIAYIFNKRCGTFPYIVAGPIASDHRSVVLHGKAPRVTEGCRVSGYINDRLEFHLMDGQPAHPVATDTNVATTPNHEFEFSSGSVKSIKDTGYGISLGDSFSASAIKERFRSYRVEFSNECEGECYIVHDDSGANINIFGSEDTGKVSMILSRSERAADIEGNRVGTSLRTALRQSNAVCRSGENDECDSPSVSGVRYLLEDGSCMLPLNREDPADQIVQIPECAKIGGISISNPATE